jgi:hypothetical protein
MIIKRIKQITLIATATFLLTGCNIYRQMIIPTPYYPEQSSNLGTEATNGTDTTVTTQSSASETLVVDSDVQQNLPTQQTVTPIKQDNVAVQNRTIVQRIPFPESEYRSLAKTGSATVTGHIYLTTAGGSKIYGKQTRLYLNPVTSYSTQWYKKSYLGGAKMSKVDSRLFNYLKFTTSDSNGKFEFLNVPSGSYYLIGVVKCGSQCGYSTPKSIRITKKISVFGSDIKSVDLTKAIN